LKSIDPGLDGAFRQISIAHKPAAAGSVNKRGIGLQKRGDLGFDGLGQELVRSCLQGFRQRVFLRGGSRRMSHVDPERAS
jgi:hypothetical protein